MKNDHRQWLYSKECPEGRIFEEGEEVPEGFFDTPAKINDVEVKKPGRPKKVAPKDVKSETDQE